MSRQVFADLFETHVHLDSLVCRQMRWQDGVAGPLHGKSVTQELLMLQHHAFPRRGLCAGWACPPLCHHACVLHMRPK